SAIERGAVVLQRGLRETLPRIGLAKVDPVVCGRNPGSLTNGDELFERLGFSRIVIKGSADPSGKKERIGVVRGLNEDFIHKFLCLAGLARLAKGLGPDR